MGKFIDFYSRAMQDRFLAARLEDIGRRMAGAAAADEKEAILAELLGLMAEEGVAFTREELLACLSEEMDRELSEAELCGAMGGALPPLGMDGKSYLSSFLNGLEM